MISLDNCCVITVVSNPIRYASRYKLYNKFKDMCSAGKIKLYTVEMAYGERPFNLTERDNPFHIQVRAAGADELWHKENLQNIGVNYVLQQDPSIKKFLMVDADVIPAMPPEQWFYETAQALEHYEIVQMWESAQDLDPFYNPIGKIQISFMAAYVKSGYKRPDQKGFWELNSYTRHGHPGFAWAFNLSAINYLGGFFDVGILGSGDRNMATALIGCFEYSMPADVTPSYRRALKRWQERAERHIKRDVGFVPGHINHYWHGSKKNRGYVDRWKILVENAYDPETDIKKDGQGLYQLETWSERQMMLRDQIRTYFRSRNEDCIYTGG